MKLIVPNYIFIYVGSFLSLFIIDRQINERKSREIANQEKEILQKEVAIMLSQIQPHFLYNSLKKELKRGKEM